MNRKIRKKYLGFGVIGWLIMIPILIIVVLILTVGFYEGRKAYWDSKVREMCEKDGGIKIYESLSISAGIYKNLEKIEGSISIPPQSLVKENQPLYHVMNENIIRESQPRVRRSEKIVKRNSDGEIIGKIISYHRVGGDFPTIIGHPTYYRCPNTKSIYRDQSKFIIIKGDRQ